MRVSAAFLLVFLSALPGFRPGDVTVQAFGPATAGHRYPQHPAGGDDDPLDVASDLDPRFLYTDDLNDPLADLRDVYGQPDYPMGVPEVGAHGDILNGFSLVSGFDVGLNGYHGNVMAAVSCPEKCLCTGTSVDCSGQNLTAVPKGISPLTTGLDLSMNNLQKLPEDTFKEMTSLRELRCVGNNLTRLPKKLFKYNTFLQLLNFQGNKFSRVPPRAFQNLRYLLELHLDANEIESIPGNAFLGLGKLQQLWLDDNKLNHVPVSALRHLTSLQALALTMNKIIRLPDYAFQNNTNLIQLRLANNQIKEIADHAFYGLSKMKYLQIHQNSLKDMPTAFSHLISLDELNLEDNRLAHLPDKSFQFKDKLTTLRLRNNPIKSIGDKVFTNLPSLLELKLSEVHDMTKFPDLTGTRNLTVIQLDRAKIQSLPPDLCTDLRKLKTFDVHSNKIGSIPKMSDCKNLTILNIANNELTSLDGRLFTGMDQLKDLTLSINFIHDISEDAFVGLSSLEYLNLAENQISEIHPDAFKPLKALKDLNLGDNRMSHLPTAGLDNLEKLKVFHNPQLREFPAKEEFPNVNNFVLSYAYHCCDFINSRQEQYPFDMMREQVVWMGGKENTDYPAMWERHDNDTRIWETVFENISVENDLWESVNSHAYDLTDLDLGPEAKPLLDDYKSHDINYVIAKAAISCKPKPGPFMPCDDLFGWWSLRCGVWFVFMLALLGNGVVFFVSVTSRSKMDVPRFLICNLAAADFFMGVYLGILAIVDASTLGQFKKYAIQWQMSEGCLVAGTLGVLSSELSVFTLTVITLERFYAITHAMQLNKRLSLKHAGIIMTCGWLWSFGLAILPLFGISDYRKFAVCLPFEIEDVISKGYVCFIMVFNGISFFIILTCYLVMYISIRDSQAWNSNDTRVAKRMALLVFTDFLCWAPIAFLSLAAAFGKNLIHLNEAKVLTIFILPLNSCANPFLYAFFTKQFKKDCVLLCRRLEDSSIARHFSQVSQRHVSMSWKCQRRPSALHSLMGEGKSGNSQGHSTASNSCGLVNYNSEISTGTNRELGKDANVDSYPLNWFIPKWGKSCDGMSGQRYSHKYKTCPGGMCDHDDMTVGGVRNGVTGQRRGKDVAPDDEAHVILHQDFYSQSGTETNACTSETYVPEEDERSHALHVQSARTEAGGDDVITSDGDLQENPGHFPIEDQEEVWRRQVDVGNPSPQYTCTAAENCAEHCPNAHKYVGGSCAETRESSSRTTDAWRSSQPRAVTSSLQRGSPAPLMSARSSFDGADKHGPDCYQMPIVGHQSASDHSLNVRDSPGSKNNVRTNGIHRNFDLDVSSNGGGGGRGNAGADGRVPSDNRGSRTSWRQNLQCCSATSSPGEPNYFDAGSSRTSNSYRSHRKSGKNTGPQYVMYMPDTEKDISKKKKKVRKNKQQQLQNHGTADTDNNMAKYSPLLSMACNKDYNVGKCTENGVKSGPRGTCLSAHTSRPPSQKPNHGTAPDSPSSTPIPESQHLPKCSEEKSLAPRGAPPSEKTQPRACKKGESTSFSGKTPDGKQQHGKKKSSRTASKGNASHQSLPHKHAMVDKSVHMRYFQQSMADGKTYVCKSNSLVELSQAQMEDVRALESAGPTKRRSLTPKQEEYMLFHGERGNCLLHSYHQQHYRHRSDSRPVYPEHGQYDSDLHFPPLLSLEKYLEGGKNTTGPKFEEDFTDIVLIENRSGANKLRTESRDWQEACDEETGVLLAEDSEEDKNRDSLSSAKNSGDLESGFHSQA